MWIHLKGESRLCVVNTAMSCTRTDEDNPDSSQFLNGSSCITTDGDEDV